MDMQSGSNGALAILPLLFMFVVGIGVYLFICYCLKLICEKSGSDPGILIWFPIVQMIPLFQAAGMNPLWIIGMFVPILNFVVSIMLWLKLCEARGKSAAWAILILIPCLGIITPIYLAFSD